MKDKLKPLIKEAKKTAQRAIHQHLAVQLKEITSKFGEGSKKLDKKIEKEAKKLARKFAKDIKINKEGLLKDNTVVKAPEAAAPKAEAPAKPAPKKVAVKPAAEPQ